jgi:hypothetical protein
VKKQKEAWLDKIMEKKEKDKSKKSTLNYNVHCVNSHNH